ncbi:MAG: MBL fold metallo-hydrolase [Promethearchaeota archaeon]
MTIKLIWLGTAAYILDLDGIKLMFDPFFFRQSNKKASPKLKTNKEDIRDIKAIFISHGHIDHITDAGWFAEMTNISVYCSEISKKNIKLWAKGEIIPDQAHRFTDKGQNNIHVVIWGDNIKITDNISVDIIKAKHIRFDANTIFARLKSREFWKEVKYMKPFSKLRAGNVLSFCINYKDKKIISMGSLCDKYEEILEKFQNSDIFISPIAGNSKKHLAQKAEKIIKIIKPKTVVPLHWDDFYPPISRVEDLRPFSKLVKKKYPHIQIIMPKIDEEIIIG